MEEVRIKLLEEGIVQNDGNAKTRVVVIDMAKRELALNDEKNWNSKSRGDLACMVRGGTPWRKGKPKWESQQQRGSCDGPTWLRNEDGRLVRRNVKDIRNSKTGG